MDLQLDGRTAVVTGAGKGIGLAITRALVAEGVHVVAGSRTLSPELESLQSGGAVTFVGVDLASVEGSTRLLEVAAVRGGGVDILVNNVGGRHPENERFRGHHRRRVGGVVQSDVLVGCTHCSRCAAGVDPPRRREHRDDQFGQRILT